MASKSSKQNAAASNLAVDYVINFNFNNAKGTSPILTPPTTTTSAAHNVHNLES